MPYSTISIAVVAVSKPSRPVAFSESLYGEKWKSISGYSEFSMHIILSCIMDVETTVDDSDLDVAWIKASMHDEGA